jgi:hypothetical protein
VTQANSVGLKPTNGHSPVAMSNGKIENNFFQRAKSKIEVFDPEDLKQSLGMMKAVCCQCDRE